MHFTILAAPAGWFTPLVRHRLDQLGPGSIVDRHRVHALIGSPRAADQFLYAAAENGLLVPTSWGKYAVPDEPTLNLLQHVPDAGWARLVSHAKSLPWILSETKTTAQLLGFMAPRLAGTVESTILGSSPSFAIPPTATSVPIVPLAATSFILDPIDPKPEKAQLNVNQRVIDVPVLSIVDSVRILQSSMEPRLGAMANELLEKAPTATRNAVRESRPRWDAPRGHPRPGRRLAAGPPQNLRLFAPEWYMHITRGALEAMARRSVQHA